MNMGPYEHVMDEHNHEVSSVAYLEAITMIAYLEAITMTLQRSSVFLLLALHDNIRKLFLLSTSIMSMMPKLRTCEWIIK